MARIPLEDNFTDIIGKAQRGLHITDEQLATRGEVTLAELTSLKSGQYNDVVARRVARHLKLHPDALSHLVTSKWYPEHPVFRAGFAAFNSAYDDMTVNSYLIWEHRSRRAAVIDPGASGDKILDYISAEGLILSHIFLTHSHEDHIADLGKILKGTNAKIAPEVWISEREAAEVPGAKPFADTTIFHVGDIPLRTYPTTGHSVGGTTYYTDSLSYPLAIVGDSIFAGSMGGSQDAYELAIKNNWKYVFSLPRDTVLACGHGPLTTLSQEKKYNPFFARH